MAPMNGAMTRGNPEKLKLFSIVGRGLDSSDRENRHIRINNAMSGITAYIHKRFNPFIPNNKNKDAIVPIIGPIEIPENQGWD